MPGNTENTDILNGLNQVVEAINSLNKPTEADGLIVQLGNVTQQLTDIAQVQLGLIGAIQQTTAAITALVLTCNTNVETTNLYQTISCGSQGSRGAGQFAADPEPQTDTPEDHAGDPPEGFASWAEYRQYKCDWATYIINQVISDIAVGALLAASYTSVGALAPILVLHLLSPIGWAEIIAIAGLFVIIWAAGVNVSLLSEVIEEDKDGFICDLYTGSDVGNSISNFADRVNSRVDEAPVLGALPEILRDQVKQLIKSYATVDSFNRLFRKSPEIIPTGNDCSACNEEEEPGSYTVILGSETSTNPANPITGLGASDPYAGCSSARGFTINFHQGVNIDAVIMPENWSPCPGLAMFWYYSAEDYTTVISSGNSFPQDGGGTTGFAVRCLYVVGNPPGSDYAIEVQYTTAP
jgi:hypothetical protein